MRVRAPRTKQRRLKRVAAQSTKQGNRLNRVACLGTKQGRLIRVGASSTKLGRDSTELQHGA